MVDAGAGIQGIGQIAERAALDADRTMVQNAETARDSWSNTKLYDPESGVFNLRGQNALGSSQATLQDYDKHVAEVAAGLKSERQIKAFALSTAQHRDAIQSQLLRFESGQRQQFENDSASARIVSATQSGALAYNDPQIQQQTRQAVLSTIDGQASRQGWDDATKSEATLKALTGVHGAVLDRMIADKRLGMASQYLKASSSEMTADEQLKFSRAIEAAKNEGKNEYKSAIASRVKDLQASYIAGLPVPPGQELTEAQIEAAYEGKGKEIYNSLQADKRMGFDLQAINKMSPGDAAQLASKYQVTVGGEGAADALTRQKEFARALQMSGEARLKNPAQFAIDNNMGYNPMPSDPEGVAAELKHRESVNAQASANVGVPVPMLTPDEAKVMGKALDAAEPDKVAQSFDFLRRNLGDQAYDAVMQQIAPDSPVKAFAGQIYGRTPLVISKTHLVGPNEQVTQRTIAETIVTGENIVNRSKQQKGQDGQPVKNLLLPDKATFDAQFTQAVGDAFADHPEQLELAQQVAYAYYVGESAKTGRLTNDKNNISTNDVNRAIRMSVGETTPFHGYQSVVAPLGMTVSDFQDAIAAQYYAETAAMGQSRESAQRAFSDIGLEPFGPNKYRATLAGKKFSLNGKPLILDVTKPLPSAPATDPLSDLSIANK